MDRKRFLFLSLSILVSSLMCARFTSVEAKATASLRVHNVNTGLNYATIQDAAYASETLDGHTIRLDAGTYFEHVIIPKSISLIGEDRNTTIIDGNGTGTVVRIFANSVRLLNLTVRNAGRTWGNPPGSGYPDTCVLGVNVQYASIENNTITSAAVCVAFLYNSFSVNITDNTVFDATFIGVLDYASHNITICNNQLFDYGSEGIHLDGGSSYCVVANNTVKNGFDGISLETNEHYPYATGNNLIEGNNISNNIANINIWGQGGTNVFRRNNMTGNQHNLVIWGKTLASFIQDIDDSNSVNNKALCCLTNCSNLSIDPSSHPNLGSLLLVNCTDIAVKDFDLTSNGDGILIAGSTNCTFANITLNGNRGHMIYGGLTFFESDSNTISESNICNNTYGVCLYHSNLNTFFHNSFILNDRNIIPDFYSPFQNISSGYLSKSIWDDGLEGNYWSDYNGTDSNHDGIGDTPYIIDVNNTDRYPLEGEVHDFHFAHTPLGFTFMLISNSTVSDFNVGIGIEHPEERIISFNVTGQSGYGFCRLCIPKGLMALPYTVSIDYGKTPVILYNETLFDNGTHRWIYFAYQHSEHQVTIVPELPSLIVIPLFVVATLVAGAIRKRRRVT